MNGDNNPHDIFISYSRKNKDAVLPIKDEIEQLGLTCWIDLSDIRCGADSFKKRVIPGIRQTRVAFLFFLSAESQSSEYAMKEINFAKKRAKKHVILVRFNDDEMTDEFFFDFQDTDIIDWRDSLQKTKLLRDMNFWSGNGGQPPPPPSVATTVLEEVYGGNDNDRDRISHFKHDDNVWKGDDSNETRTINVGAHKEVECNAAEFVTKEKELVKKQPVNGTPVLLSDNVWLTRNASGGATIKLLIVGAGAAGKTVAMAGLGDLTLYPDEDGYFFEPDLPTESFVDEMISGMRQGVWPPASLPNEFHCLNWMIKRREPDVQNQPQTIGKMSVLEFPGEACNNMHDLQCKVLLKRHVEVADYTIVLINLRDVVLSKGVRERERITKSILDTIFSNDMDVKRPVVAIGLSQADEYSAVVEKCGGPKGVIEKYLPRIAINYGWLDVLAISAVDKTVSGPNGFKIPSSDFTTKGLMPVMSWIWRKMCDVLTAGTVKTLTLPGGLEMRLCWCPPGKYVMGGEHVAEYGQADKSRSNEITFIRGFWIGEVPITRAQWQSVMGEAQNVNHMKAPELGQSLVMRIIGTLSKMSSTRDSTPNDSLPMVNVSWEDSQAFIRKLNKIMKSKFRLPSDREWEYACRAGNTGSYGGSGGLSAMGWYNENSSCEVHPVRQKRPNAWGIYDMHGNVWEWCADVYDDSAGDANEEAPKLGVEVKRILRGGSYLDDRQYCSASFRFGNWANYHSRYNGFRLCCSVDPCELFLS